MERGINIDRVPSNPPEEILRLGKMVHDLMPVLVKTYGFLNLEIQRAQKGQPGHAEAEGIRQKCISLISEAHLNLEKWTEQLRALHLSCECDEVIVQVSKLTSAVAQELQEFRSKLDDEVERIKDACDRDVRYECKLIALGRALLENKDSIWPEWNRLWKSNGGR